jgi:hypothetical protein
MGRPKKATGGRKALAKKDTNVAAKVELKPLEDIEEEAEDLEEQLRIVNLICQAVDQEGGLPFDGFVMQGSICL